MDDKEPNRTEFNGKNLCQIKGHLLEVGDAVLFNDRSRPLTVIGKHTRHNTSQHFTNNTRFHTVVELEGNNIEYHLVCTRRDKHGPVLYKESNWDDDKSNKFGQKPKYSRGGERIESISVTNRSLGIHD